MDKLTVLKSTGHTEMYPKAKEIFYELLYSKSHRKVMWGKHCASANMDKIQNINISSSFIHWNVPEQMLCDQFASTKRKGR